MNDYQNILDLIFDNLKKIFYPQEWISLDLEFSKSEVFTLLLADRYGEMIMSNIADSINVSMSTANGIVERLVKGGYLDRDRSETDRRIVVIRLSDKGKHLVNELKRVILEYIKLIYDALDEEERKLIFKIIDKIAAILQQKNIQNQDETAEDQLKNIPIE